MFVPQRVTGEMATLVGRNRRHRAPRPHLRVPGDADHAARGGHQQGRPLADRLADRDALAGPAGSSRDGGVVRRRRRRLPGEGGVRQPRDARPRRGLDPRASAGTARARRFPTNETFDSSATPEFGEEQARPLALEQLDLADILEALAEEVAPAAKSSAPAPADLRPLLARMDAMERRQEAVAETIATFGRGAIALDVFMPRCARWPSARRRRSDPGRSPRNPHHDLLSNQHRPRRRRPGRTARGCVAGGEGTAAGALLALAERCEAATGVDRGLDADIARAMGWRFAAEGHPIGDTWYNPARRAFPLPRYTANLDAAMTLVPEGAQFYVDSGLHGRGRLSRLRSPR